MIEGRIQGYDLFSHRLEDTVTVSFSTQPSADMTHRMGHKVYLLTEDEYKDLQSTQTKDSWQQGYDEGYEEGRDERQEDAYDEGYDEGYAVGHEKGVAEGKAAIGKEIERVLET